MYYKFDYKLQKSTLFLVVGGWLQEKKNWQISEA